MPLTQVTLLDSLPDLLEPPNSGCSEWDWWTAAVGGLRVGGFQPLAPQTGFYRFRPRKSDRGEPCAIYWEHGRWWCLLGDRVEDDVAHAWRWSHANPITHELYESVLAGAPWPGEIAAQVETPAAGHNSGAPEQELHDEISAAHSAFLAWLANNAPIRNDVQDETAEGYRKRFLDFRKRAEEGHKAEKAPILEKAREIDGRWITGQYSVKAFAQSCQDQVAEALKAYRIERDRKAQEARAATKATSGRQQAPTKASGLRTVPRAVITDLRALVVQLADQDNAELRDLAERLALRMLRAGAVVAGAHLIEEKRV